MAFEELIMVRHQLLKPSGEALGKLYTNAERREDARELFLALERPFPFICESKANSVTLTLPFASLTFRS